MQDDITYRKELIRLLATNLVGHKDQTVTRVNPINGGNSIACGHKTLLSIQGEYEGRNDLPDYIKPIKIQTLERLAFDLNGRYELEKAIEQAEKEGTELTRQQKAVKCLKFLSKAEISTRQKGYIKALAQGKINNKVSNLMLNNILGF